MVTLTQEASRGGTFFTLKIAAFNKCCPLNKISCFCFRELFVVFMWILTWNFSFLKIACCEYAAQLVNSCSILAVGSTERDKFIRAERLCANEAIIRSRTL